MLLRAGLALAIGVAWAFILGQWGDMPHATEYQDDGLYFVGAQSLSTGQGHKILSLPGEPAQTKYPPGFPAWLSIAWRLGGDFPQNLRWATALCVVWLPILAGLFWLWLGRVGIRGHARDWLTALLMLNPYMVLFSLSMFTEISFTAFVLASWLLLERGHPKAAGALAALAYLWRTAGLALLPAGILWMLWRKDRRGAFLFGATLLPVVLAWMVWSRLHTPPGQDIVTLYYTNYLGYHLLNFKMGEAHLFLWKNLDGLLQGLGSFLVPKLDGALWEKILAQTVCIAGLSGLVRLIRAGNDTVRGYSWFGAFYALQLLLWHFAPNERFVLPLFPLLVVGWTEEFGRLWQAIRRQRLGVDPSQRKAAWVLTGLGGCIALGCLAMQIQVLTQLLPEFMAQHRRDWAELAPAWAELRKGTEPVLTDADTLLYLATGRKAVSLIVPTLTWYREDWDARRAAFRAAAAYARQQKVRWFLLRQKDFSRDMETDMHQRLLAELRADPEWELVQQWGTVSLYRLKVL